MNTSDLCVVHIPEMDEDALLTTQQQIVSELSAGRCVVAVCENKHVKRAEQLTLASAAILGRSGRFAVVTPNPHEFEALPQSVRQHFSVFSTQDEAVQWLQPESRLHTSTLIYFEL